MTKGRMVSKWQRFNPNHPSARGQCDTSTEIFNHKDLIYQKEWMGNQLRWTGSLVGKPFVDKPNPQLRPPLVKGDPKAVKDPRPAFYLTNSPPAPPLSVWAQQMLDCNWGLNQDLGNNQ